MADTQIITKQELNYVETLYLYANLEEFINPTEHPDIDGYGAYILMMQYLNDNLLHTGTYLSDSNGRMWYKFDNYRLGIMDYNKALKASQYNAIIQYEWEHLYSLDPKLMGLDLPFGGTHDQYHIKRIDITKMFKSEHDYLTNKGFISTYRKINRHGSSDKIETVYLGNRSNGNVYRMYDKTIELKLDNEKHPINHKKIELLSKYFGDIEDLYTFELELHRSYLKEQLEITTLDQLEEVYRAYSSIVGRVRIYEDTDHNKDLISSNNRARIEAYTVTPYVEYKKVYRAKSKPSKEYLFESINKKISRYEEQMGELSKFELIEGLIESKYEEIVNITISDIEPTLGSSVVGYNEMKEKHERLRDGNDELQSEAWNAFKPYPYINPDEIF